jgi:hypothetical protein
MEAESRDRLCRFHSGRMRGWITFMPSPPETRLAFLPSDGRVGREGGVPDVVALSSALQLQVTTAGISTFDAAAGSETVRAQL